MFQIVYETADGEQFAVTGFATAWDAAVYLAETMLSPGGLASEKIPGDFRWVQIELEQ